MLSNNTLCVSVANTTTIWPPTQMPRWWKSEVKAARRTFSVHQNLYAHWEWARILVDEAEAEPVARNLKKLRWHLRNPWYRAAVR